MRPTWRGRPLRRLCLGAYVDDDGALHLAIDELLARAGVADTPANRQVCLEEAQKALAREAPLCQVIVVEEEEEGS